MTPKTPDYGHKEADKELTALVRRLHLSYRSASISLQEKLEKYLEKFAEEDKEMRALYDSGEMSHEDYMKWRMRKLAGTKQWKAMLNQLANDMTHQNEIAASKKACRKSNSDAPFLFTRSKGTIRRTGERNGTNKKSFESDGAFRRTGGQRY